MTPWEHLERLSHLGPRPIGSPANDEAASCIAGVFARAGLAVEEQPYACTAWEHTGTSLRICGDEGPAADARANAFSVSCDVTARVVAASTVDELEAIYAAQFPTTDDLGIATSSSTSSSSSGGLPKLTLRR